MNRWSIFCCEICDISSLWIKPRRKFWSGTFWVMGIYYLRNFRLFFGEIITQLRCRLFGVWSLLRLLVVFGVKEWRLCQGFGFLGVCIFLVLKILWEFKKRSQIIGNYLESGLWWCFYRISWRSREFILKRWILKNLRLVFRGFIS